MTENVENTENPTPIYQIPKDFPEHSIDENVFLKDKEEMELLIFNAYNNFIKKYPFHTIFYRTVEEGASLPFKVEYESFELSKVSLHFDYNAMYLK